MRLIKGKEVGHFSNDSLQRSQFSSKFVRYGNEESNNFGGTSAIPAWIIAEKNYSEIHRFFDTSPFSPSGRYLAILRVPKGERVRELEEETAHIVVYDLRAGPSSSRIIASTTAWDSQTGSHIQWGATDDALFYNVRLPGTAAVDADAGVADKDIKLGRLRGVVHNIFSDKFRYLDCPVYHVSSDGQYATSPDLTKISFTQLGYGVRLRSAVRNLRAPVDDGVYLISIASGKCRLLSSLHELAIVGGLDTEKTQTYGFHTKFSSDGKLIMFVVRTLHRTVGSIKGRRIKTGKMGQSTSDKVLNVISELLPSSLSPLLDIMRGGTIRTQHLFVLRTDGSAARLILSWGDSSLDGSSSRISDGKTGPAISGMFDGNHPNWIPGTHDISMNLRDRDGDQGEHDSKNGIHGKYSSTAEKKLKYKVVVIKADSALASECHDLIRGSDQSSLVHQSSGNNTSSCFVEMYPHGSGHPTYRKEGRYLLMDAYPKERGGLQSLSVSLSHSYSESIKGLDSSDSGVSERLRLRPGSVPLRLVDTVDGKEIWLMQVRGEQSRRLELLINTMGSEESTVSY